MNDFFSWQVLGTFAGAAMATGIVTQFIKGFFSKLPTQVLSYIIAVILLFAATAFTGGLTPSTGALVPFNAVIVAMSSNGAFDAVKRVSERKTK